MARPHRVFGVLIAIMVLVAMLPIAPAAGAPAVIYVDAMNGDDGTGAGTFADPYRSISHAMDQAAAGTTIYTQPGMYDTSIESGFPIALKPGVMLVALEGPGLTAIDAEITDRVVYIADAIANTGISGFTIQSGSASFAAGIWIYQASTPGVEGWPLVEDCIIQDNVATTAGGGIYIEGAGASFMARPLIVGCDISYNEAGPTSSGGGVFSYHNAEPVIRDCRISSNSAGYGAGLATYDATTLEQCDVVANSALSEGGGAQLADGAKVRDCWIAANTAGDNGGGLSLNYANGRMVVERTKIEVNSSGGVGGGVYVNGAQIASFRSSVVANNEAVSHGGAIYVSSNSGNTELSLAGCTVADNSSDEWDGIYCFPGEGLTVADSIVRHPATPATDAEDVTSPHAVTYSNTYDTDISGTGVIHSDPQFMDPPAGDYELKLGSPCIDTGDPASLLTFDVLDRVRPEDGDGNGTVRSDMGAWERPLPEAARIAGTNRYETAGIMAQWREWQGTTAVLASGAGFADALSGSGLAGAYQGPLLLTAKDSVPGIVFDALQDAGISDVVIVGGPAVISDAVKVQLAAQGYGVTRVWGANRYATAAAVAEEIVGIMGQWFTGTAFLARGDEFADALAASPLAYSEATPVLLTAPGSLPAATQGAITDLGIGDVVVVGGTSAVSEGVKNAVDALPGVDTERVAAGNRYATAVAVAEWGVDGGWATWKQVGIATGTNYPDALAGGALCGIRRGVLLLTQPAALPTATRDVLAANKAEVVYAEVYGGKNAVSDAVKAAIDTALGW